MAAPIGPGDWVECVDNTPRPWHFGPYIEALEELRVGGVYQVRAIDRAGDLFLVGIPTGSERLGFGPDALGFDEAAAAMRAAREALPQLAATLAKPSLNKEANRGH